MWGFRRLVQRVVFVGVFPSGFRGSGRKCGRGLHHHRCLIIVVVIIHVVGMVGGRKRRIRSVRLGPVKRHVIISRRGATGVGGCKSRRIGTKSVRCHDGTLCNRVVRGNRRAIKGCMSFLGDGSSGKRGSTRRARSFGRLMEERKTFNEDPCG
jgi:hypothetical protein